MQRLRRRLRRVAQGFRQRQQPPDDVAAQQLQAVDHRREQLRALLQFTPKREARRGAAQKQKRCAQSVRPRHGSSSSV